MWFSGSGESVSIQQILEKVKKHSLNNGTVFIGCDSQITKESCVHSTVICMHGADNQHGGYYFLKEKKTTENNTQLWYSDYLGKWNYPYN